MPATSSPSRRIARLAVTMLVTAIAVLTATAARPNPAQAQVKQVLLLQSLNRGNLILDNFTGNFRVNLDQRAGKAVNVVQVVVGPTGFVGAPETSVVDYIQAMYAGRKPPDLIMTAGGTAAVFARRYRQQLFPKTPLLLAAVDQRYIDDAPLRENETAVAALQDFPLLVEDILRVRPETRNVFMVIGSGTIGQFWHRQLQESFRKFDGRLSFTWSHELPLGEILQRVAALPETSAILYLLFSTDAQGGAYADEQVLAEIHKVSRAPLFSGHTSHFGLGTVGGTLMAMEDLAQRTADAASRILSGEPPASLRSPPQLPGPRLYDWRELQRWGIPESRLPEGSIVKFRPPSLWEEHKGTIAASAAAIVLQSLLIVGLLLERRRRRRAEIESRRNLALAADANRRETISALTTSIGHELAQPLTAVLLNVKALQKMLSAKPQSAEQAEEILADIQAEATLAARITDRHRAMLRSRQLDKRPIDLHAVIRDSLALAGHDMRARHVEATLDLYSTPCVIEGDPVLLQQVFLNLVRNAIDALAEVPAPRRRIIIRTAISAASIEISVCDTGPGVPGDKVPDLFMPFMTTKPNGLGVGLTIARSIVEAHEGRIGFHPNLDGGATFTVSLPRKAQPRVRLVHPEPAVHDVADNGGFQAPGHDADIPRTASATGKDTP